MLLVPAKTTQIITSYPREPGARGYSGPLEDDSSRNAVRVPRKPGAYSAPSLREDGTDHNVVPSPPESGKHCALGLREDVASRNIVRLPPAPGTLGDPCPRDVDTRRTLSRAKSTSLPLTAFTTPRSDSQDVRIVLRCGYGNPGARDRCGRSARDVHARP